MAIYFSYMLERLLQMQYSQNSKVYGRCLASCSRNRLFPRESAVTTYKSFVLVQTMCYEERIVGYHMNHSSYPHHKKNCNYIGKILSQMHVVRGVLFLHSAARGICCSKSLTSLKIYKLMSKPVINLSVLKVS